MAEAALNAPPYTVETFTAGGKEQWLTARRGGIGASEMPVILGVSDWGSVLDIYYEKTGEIVPSPDPLGEFVQWGKLLEGAIREELARRAGVTLHMNEPLLRSTLYPWALATPDALTSDGEPVEVKNISYGYDADEWEVGIPQKYHVQVQQQLLVTGANRALFGALLWGSRLIWEWVPRDEVAIRQIVHAGSAFWDRVERRDPPPSDGHKNARRALAKLAMNGDAVELYEADIDTMLSAWMAAESDLKAARANARNLEKQRDAAADAIAQAMTGHREAYTATGWRFTWNTTQRRGYTVEPKIIEQFKIEGPKGK